MELGVGFGGWGWRLLVAARSGHEVPGPPAVLGVGLARPLARWGRFSTCFVVEFQARRGDGESGAVPWLACLPRSGASMAHLFPFPFALSLFPLALGRREGVAGADGGEGGELEGVLLDEGLQVGEGDALVVGEVGFDAAVVLAVHPVRA